MIQGRRLFQLFIILHIVSILEGKIGVDIAYFNDVVSVETAKCWLQNNISFAIVEILGSPGTLNTKAPETILNFQKAGFTDVDIYIYPKVTLNPAAQIYSVFTFLKSYNATAFNNVWIDIETDNDP